MSKLSMSFPRLKDFFSPTRKAGHRPAAPDPYELLSPDMRETSGWTNDKDPPHHSVESTVSGRIWAGIPGGHKWLGYFPIYDKEFERFRGTSPRVLEIGVYRGASLRLWKEFFGAGSHIVGVDIDMTCSSFHCPTDGLFVEIGSQADAEFLQSVIAKHGPFDVVIDDGSHIASHQIASFNALFGPGLKDGGLYFVEDLECMYWGHTDEFRDQNINSISFFKMLIDVQNMIFSGYEYTDFALHGLAAKNEFIGPKIARYVDSVKFYRGIAIVGKSKQEPPRVLHI